MHMKKLLLVILLCSPLYGMDNQVLLQKILYSMENLAKRIDKLETNINKGDVTSDNESLTQVQQGNQQRKTYAKVVPAGAEFSSYVGLTILLGVASVASGIIGGIAGTSLAALSGFSKDASVSIGFFTMISAMVGVIATAYAKFGFSELAAKLEPSTTIYLYPE